MLNKSTGRAAGIVSAIAFAAATLAGQPLVGHAAAGGTLFGITGYGQSVLSTIDPATGIVTNVEDLAGSEQGQLVSVTGDPIAHRIYAVREATIFTPPSTIDVHNQLLTINSDTGSYTASAINAVGPGQIAFDPGAGVLYQLGFQKLTRIDPSSMKTATVATLPVSPADITGLVVVPGANTVYVGQSIFDYTNGGFSHDVITVNTVTGVTSTSVVSPGRLGFLMYDPSARLLLTMDNQNLFTIDPATGAETLIVNYNPNPAALFFFDGAIDPTTNTVYLHMNIYDFLNPPPVDQIVSINDLTDAFSTSPDMTFGSGAPLDQLESLYFQPLVTVTPDSIAADVRSSLASGQITKAGVANTLLSDLDAALAARNRGQCKTAANDYQQFIADVAAQSGKSIAVATASRLTSEAEYLQANCA